MSYDVIGDIHGHGGKLQALLREMGYRHHDGAWRHPGRTAVFVGDFIDRGPEQLGTLHVVRAMLDTGAGQAVLGNHELNAVAWWTPDPDRPGDFLRTHRGAKGERNLHQHRAFLEAVGDDERLHAEWVGWFLTLPLWLDLGPIRIVHACWHPRFLEHLASRLQPGARMSRDLLPAATREPPDEEKDTPEPTAFKAADALLKGLEIPLPEGHTYTDKDGHVRRRVRVRWWDPEATTYRRAARMPGADRLPDLPVPEHVRIGYRDPVPVFFGHYWETGERKPFAPNVACVDYSAGKGGPLVAYRWDGEESLRADRFVAVG